MTDTSRARLLSAAEVGELLGRRASTIRHWARVRKSGFPRPIKLHANAEPRWRLSDVAQFVDRMATRQLERPPRGRLLQGPKVSERVRLTDKVEPEEQASSAAGDEQGDRS